METGAPTPRWEHFNHDADIGIRGIAATLEQSFEQAALALTAVVTDLGQIETSKTVTFCCKAADEELLFFDWINELIYELSANRVLFSHFQVSINYGTLTATAWGEHVDVTKHQLAVEVKGATFTELRVYQNPDGLWVAQCVVDV